MEILKLKVGVIWRMGSRKKIVRKRLEAKYKKKLGNKKHFSLVIKKQSRANFFNDLNHQYQSC